MTTVDLSGQTLTQLRVEFTAGLEFTGEYFVRIETSFTLDANGTTVSLSPDADPPDAFASLRDLVGQTIAKSEVSDTGTLSLTFENGAHVVVGPDGDYEAWTVTGPGGLVVVCMPSGELATWVGLPPVSEP